MAYPSAAAAVAARACPFVGGGEAPARLGELVSQRVVLQVLHEELVPRGAELCTELRVYRQGQNQIIREYRILGLFGIDSIRYSIRFGYVIREYLGLCLSWRLGINNS